MNPLRLEHATLTAWPAAVRESRFGWEFCATRGCSGRVNSIWPLAWTRESAIELAIAHAVAWCEQNGIDPCFRLSDGLVAPVDLPRFLKIAGYAPQNETLVMTLPLQREGSLQQAQGSARFDGAGPPVRLPEPAEDGACADIELVETPDETIWSPLRAAAPSDADFAERQDIVARIAVPRAFARASLDGKPAAIGMGVLTPDPEGNLLGLYLMRTAPDARRRGLAREIVAALLDWGAARGARCAYLQVEKHNTAAVTLYERAGFTTAYAYWYWRRPSPLVGEGGA